jgi:hypothetical protein
MLKGHSGAEAREQSSSSKVDMANVRDRCRNGKDRPPGTTPSPASQTPKSPLAFRQAGFV